MPSVALSVLPHTTVDLVSYSAWDSQEDETKLSHAIDFLASHLPATAAFGLHRVKTGGNGTDWMPGMWGPDAGPGTIYRLDADSGFIADKFTDITLNGRPNSGAALGFGRRP